MAHSGRGPSTPDSESLAMRNAVVTHAKRTPIGKFLGSYRDLATSELAAIAIRSVLSDSGLDPREVDEVILGCARQAGLGPNPARQATIKAGLPESVPASTINMACGSGAMALVHAARSIALGEAECVVAGGMENMTRVPFLLPDARLGYRMGHASMVDGMYQDGFLCPLAGQVMGETAETLARKYGISRTEQDAFAARSQNRAEAAASRFPTEIAPVEITSKKGSVRVSADEHPRKGVTAESLAQLPPVFSTEGTVTAGNSSGITDGAAVLLIMSEDAARGRGLQPLAVLEGWQSAGVDPKIMGIGPVPATRRLLERLGHRLESYDLIELNEAFAAQVIACDRELHLDPEKLNVNGGSIALGHPIGATGARIAVTLIHEMARRNVRRGLATLCISGGMGLSLSFQRGS